VKVTVGIDCFQDLTLAARGSPVDRLLAVVAVAVVDGVTVVDCVAEKDDPLSSAMSVTRGDLREVFAA
jgi:ribonuclease PH